MSCPFERTVFPVPRNPAPPVVTLPRRDRGGSGGGRPEPQPPSSSPRKQSPALRARRCPSRISGKPTRRGQHERGEGERHKHEHDEHDKHARGKHEHDGHERGEDKHEHEEQRDDSPSPSPPPLHLHHADEPGRRGPSQARASRHRDRPAEGPHTGNVHLGGRRADVVCEENSLRSLVRDLDGDGPAERDRPAGYFSTTPVNPGAESRLSRPRLSYTPTRQRKVPTQGMSIWAHSEPTSCAKRTPSVRSSGTSTEMDSRSAIDPSPLLHHADEPRRRGQALEPAAVVHLDPPAEGPHTGNVHLGGRRADVVCEEDVVGAQVRDLDGDGLAEPDRPAATSPPRR
jgi:hypothetical protein